MFASQDADRKQNQTPPPTETGNKHQLFTGYFFETKVHCHLPRNFSPNGNHFHNFQLDDFYSGNLKQESTLQITCLIEFSLCLSEQILNKVRR